MDRVKFYSTYDWACDTNLKKLKEVLDKFNETECYSINDVIEFYNCIKYISNNYYLNDWTAEYVEKLKNKSKSLNKVIGCFLLKIDDNNIISTINDIDYMYREDFWELFDTCKVYNRISDLKFEEILKNRYILETISYFKNIVNHYGNIIRKYLLTYEDSAIILLDKYEIVREHNSKQIYLPKELTNEDKELMLKKYIESKNPNINYLRVIFNMQSTKEMPISAKTRLMAKKKIKEESDKIFDKYSGIVMETLVRFSKNMKNEKEVTMKGQKIDCQYSSAWLEQNTDYPTLLNNFIYLFEFTDIDMRSNFVSKESQLDVFEKHIFIQTRRSYRTGIVFDRLEILSTLQMMVYCKELKRINIRFENIIEWFFKEYLLNEFSIKDYKVNMPSEGSNYLEKCRTTLSELDNILKEYRLVVEDNEIDHELLQISSRPIPFYDIPSKIGNKYIYANSEEYNLITYLFFSNQCMLKHVDGIEEEYNNFFDLIRCEKIKPENCSRYEQNNLNILISKDYIEIDEEGYLKFKNKERIAIFKDLNYNEVVCYWHYPKNYQNEIDKMINEGILKSESTLFSRPEIDYLNYYLNKSEFNNGLDLRNMYIHGTQPNEIKSDKIHETNYMRILKILILAIIKINDDLCTYYDNKNDIPKFQS